MREFEVNNIYLALYSRAVGLIQLGGISSKRKLGIEKTARVEGAKKEELS